MAVISLYYISSYNRQDNTYGITDTNDGVEEFYSYGGVISFLQMGIKIKGVLSGLNGGAFLAPVCITKRGTAGYLGYTYSEPEFDEVLLAGDSTHCSNTHRGSHRIRLNMRGDLCVCMWDSRTALSIRTGTPGALEFTDGNMVYYRTEGGAVNRAFMADFRIGTASDFFLVPVDSLVDEFGSVGSACNQIRDNAKRAGVCLDSALPESWNHFTNIKGVYNTRTDLSGEDVNLLESLDVRVLLASVSVFNADIDATSTETGVFSEPFVLLSRSQTSKGVVYNVLVKGKGRVRSVKKMGLIDVINARAYAFPEIIKSGDEYLVSSLSGVHAYSDIALRHYYPSDYIDVSNKVRQAHSMLLGDRNLLYDLKPDGTALNIRYATGSTVTLKSPIKTVPRGSIVSKGAVTIIIDDSIQKFSSNPFKETAHNRKFVIESSNKDVIMSVCKCSICCYEKIEIREENLGYFLRCLVYCFCSMRIKSHTRLRYFISDRLTIRMKDGVTVLADQYPVDWGLILKDVFFDKSFFNQFSDLMSKDIEFRTEKSTAFKDLQTMVGREVMLGELTVPKDLRPEIYNSFLKTLNIYNDLCVFDTFVEMFNVIPELREHTPYTNADDFNFLKSMCVKMKEKLDTKLEDFWRSLQFDRIQ